MSLELPRWLHGVDELMKCPICFEHFVNPVVIPCGHSCMFLADLTLTLTTDCSVCIRRSLKDLDFKCPICKEDAPVKDIMVNRRLAELIDAWHVVKKQDHAPALPEPTVTLPEPILIEEKPVPISEGCVACPNCAKSVEKDFINQHLDECLVQEKKPHPFSALFAQSKKKAPRKRQKMPLLVYNLVKPAALRGKLSKLGLPTHGDKPQLEWRHREFTIRYNAECDSLHPASNAEIAKQVTKSEGARLEAVQVTSPKTLHNEEDMYQRLISDINQRREKKQHDVMQVHHPQIATTQPTHSLPFPWRAIYSETAGAVFYYNPILNLGQFEPPEEMSKDRKDRVGVHVVDDHVAESEEDFVETPRKRNRRAAARKAELLVRDSL